MRIALALLLFAGSLSAQVNIILDDDCATDYCPVVAAFKLMDQGKINLMALIADSQNTLSAPAMKAHAVYYGRPNLPVYANQQNTPGNSFCITNNCNGFSGWTTPFIAEFRAGDTRANYTDCLTGYRTILAAAANSSIVIVNAGFATCLMQLMQSPADGISSLTGAQLIQQKVSKLVGCCGINPSGFEFNFNQDYPSWSYLFANWTSQNGYPPIWLFSYGDGLTPQFGPPAYASNTINTVSAMFGFLGTTQKSIWDEGTVFLGYCGLTCGGVTYWADAGNGTMVVNSAANTPINGQAAGYNSWSTGTASGQHYVTNVASDAQLSHLFDGYAYGFGLAGLAPLVSLGDAAFGNTAKGITIH